MNSPATSPPNRGKSTRRSRLAVRGWLLAGFIAALTVFVILSAVSYRSARRSIAISAEVAKAHKVLATLYALDVDVATLVNGVRGFAATGRESFIARHADQVSAIQEKQRMLRDLLAKESPQAARLEALRKLVATRLAFADQVVDAQRRDPAAAAAIIATGRGEELILQIGALVAEIARGETAHLAERDQEANDAAARMLILLPIGTCIVLGLLFAGLYFLNSEIAERREAAEALNESSKKLSAAQRSARLGYWERDLAGNFTGWSHEAYDIMGISAQGGSRSPAEVLELVHPEDRPALTAAIETAMRESKPFELEYRVRRADGEVRHVHARGDVETDASGKPIRLLETMRDITDAKRAEETMRRNERRLAEAQRVAHVGHWERDLRGNFTNWSDEAYRIFGLRAGDGELDHASFLALLHPDDRDKVAGALATALAGGERYEMEYRIVRADGTERLVNSEGDLVRDAAGQPLSLFGTILDVTNLRRAEIALRHSERNLVAAQRLAHVGHWEWDANGNLSSWSEETSDIFGLPREPMHVALESFLEKVHPDDRERVGRALRNSLESGQHYDVDYRIVRSDGTVRHVHSEGDVALDADRSAQRLFGTVMDITSRKQSEEALRESEERLRTLMDSTAEAIYGLDTDGNCTFCNAACVRMLGYSDPGELLGRNMHEVAHHHRADGSAYPVAECKIYEAFKAETNAHVDDEVFWRKDGTSFDVEYWSFPLRSGGRVVGSVVTFFDITERKRAEAELRASVERFGALVAATSQMVWSTDANGLVTGPIPTWQAYTGQSDEEIRGAGWVGAVHPEDAARTLAVWREAVEKQSLYEVEYRVRRHDGTYRHFMARGVPVLNTDGTIREWVGTCTDVHDEKLAQAALEESEERLNLALKASGVGTWSWNMVENSIIWDDYIHPLFGLKPRTFPGKYDAFVALLYPADRERVSAEVMATVERDVPYDTEFRVVWEDATMHWVAARGKVYRDDTGQPLRMTGVCWDVTARKQAEAERDRFFSLALDPLCIASPDGYFRRLNPAFERILGFPVEEMLHRPFMDFIHPDDRASTIAVVEQLAAGAELVNFENRYLCKDGSYRWFLWMSAPSGGLLYATARDITDRKKAEEQLRQAHDTLEQRVAERTAALEAANKELEAFSYSVSHDLRAPLRGIDSFSRMVIEDYGPSLDADGQRQLNVIRSEAQRMGQLIDELLRFSRLAREEVRLASFDMTALAQGVIDELPAAARERVKEFRLQPLPPVYGDRAMLRQVWVNLIGNAVKYSGTVAAPVIEVSGEQVDGVCTYRVKDNGVGFDPRYTHKLFGVFQRLHAEHEFEGTGVGLAIVQRIIHRHGGTVAAEGMPGKGATFSFSLPSKRQTDNQTEHGKPN